MRHTSAKTVVVLLIAALAGSRFAQAVANQKPTPPTLNSSQALLQAWHDVGRKLIAMAEDFPEDKYDFRLTPAQFTFAEQLLHAAGSNDLFSDVAKGLKPIDDEDRAHFPGKAAVVAYLKQSFEKGSAVIRAKGEAGMSETVVDSESGQRLPLTALGWKILEHCGEHYGQLVGYYRVAGLVPPESRPRK